MKVKRLRHRDEKARGWGFKHQLDACLSITFPGTELEPSSSPLPVELCCMEGQMNGRGLGTINFVATGDRETSKGSVLRMERVLDIKRALGQGQE